MGIQIGHSNIDMVYYGKEPISEIYQGTQLLYSSGVVLTINTVPADATVVFNIEKANWHSVKVKKGTIVNYTVSRDGYYSVSGSFTVTENMVQNVSLEQIYYNDGQTLWESGGGGAAATLNLLTSGRYRVICIGGGGGGIQSQLRHATGGSGSGFDCVFYLNKGDYYVYVGNGGYPVYQSSGGSAGDGENSQFGTSVAYGGKGGCNWPNPHGGEGGAGPTITYQALNVYLNSAGNYGLFSSNNIYDQTASIYGLAGAGGRAINSDQGDNRGNAGYVKVIFLGK